MSCPPNSVGKPRNLLKKVSWAFVAGATLPLGPLFAQSVKLAWDLSPSPQVLQYNIYRATHPDSSYTFLGSVQHPDSIYTDAYMQYSVHYYYVATCQDRFGTESGFSNRIDTTLQYIVPVLNHPAAEGIHSAHLYQNYPNPFNASTEIAYDLMESGLVQVVIYNTLGCEIRRLVDHYQPRGRHTLKWDARDAQGREITSGLYYCKITAGAFMGFREMVVVK